MIQIINPNKRNNLKKQKKRKNAGGRLGQAQYGTLGYKKPNCTTILSRYTKNFITIMMIMIIIIIIIIITVYWDVPVYADHIEVHANRVDVRIVDKENQTVTLLEMSCPWVENREQKEKEKTLKYAPLRLELKQQYPGYTINQVNNIIDVLGGYSKELYSSVRDLLGAEPSRECLRGMQKSVLSSSFNIARSFEVLS